MWETFFLNEAINTNWDILQNIISSLAQFQHRPSLRHVKGHQDSQVSYTLLSLLAKLNIDANRLASRYQAPSDLHFNIVLAITGCNAYVSIKGNTITSNLAMELQHAASSASLEKYLSDKYSWSGIIYHNIDWPAHYTSIKNPPCLINSLSNSFMGGYQLGT